MKQTVYVLTELSSGDVRLEIDNLEVFTNREDAESKLKASYKDLIKSLKGYGEITEKDIDNDHYSILFEDYDGDTLYEGTILEKEIQ